MADPTPLNRNQIAAFVGNDPDAIRAIERLFKVAGQLTPADIAALTQLILDSTYATGAADNKAEVSLTVATRADSLAELFATAPAAQDPRLDQLIDVSVASANDQDLLQYDSVKNRWQSTANSTNVLLWLEAY
jgi:hypothetical protein